MRPTSLSLFAAFVFVCSNHHGQADVIVPLRVLATGDTTVQGDTIQSLAAEAASINNAGNLAVQANVTGANGTGASIIAVDIAPSGSVTRTRFTFASPSSTRTYNSPWRLDNGDIGARDALSGGSPGSFVRFWNAGSFTILASTTRDAFDFVQLPSFSKSGSHYAFVGFTGSNGLYIQSNSGAQQLVGTLTGGGFRPMTANDGRTVIRTGNNSRIAMFLPTGGESPVSPANLTNPGSMPGITDDGGSVAYQGDLDGIPGIYASIDGIFETLALRKDVIQPIGPFETWRDANGDRIIQPAEISGGLLSFSPGRVGIKEIERPFRSQLLTVFAATGIDGQPGIYYARLDRETGRIHGTSRIARGGATLGGFTPTSFFLTDPLNIRGQIVFQASDGTSAAVFRHQATLFTKYKQGVETQFDVIAIGAHPSTSWFDKPVNPNLPVEKRRSMGRVGCALTSAATIAGIFGKETTPLEMRDHFLGLSPPAIDKNNNTWLSRLDLRIGDKALRKAGDGGNFDDIAAELRAGRPVLLCVPIKGSAGVATTPGGAELTLPNGNLRANDKRHYIIAYALDATIGPADPVTAADIHVSDPAFTSAYRTKYLPNYSAGEESVNVTLQDYFDIQNSASSFTFDARNWFDHSTFVRKSDGKTVGVVQGDRSRQIQRFAVIENPPPMNPVVEVNSPVEVRITLGGVTYASSPGVALAGDVLAIRHPAEIVAEFDQENEIGQGESEPTDPFPPYLLELPPAAAGLAAQVEIHGTGDGEYEINLGTGADGLVAANRLAGTITQGAVVRGIISVVPDNTAPGNAGSVPSIESAGPGNFVVKMPSVPGGVYQLETCIDLGDWVPAGPPVTADSGEVRWTVPKEGTARFYRVSYTLPP